MVRVTGPVRDGIVLLVDDLALTREFRRIAQESEKWRDPLVTRFGDARGTFPQPLDLRLVGRPEGSRTGPSIGDLVFDSGVGRKAKVLRALPILPIAGSDGLDDIPGEDAAFYAYGGVVHVFEFEDFAHTVFEILKSCRWARAGFLGSLARTAASSTNGPPRLWLIKWE